MTPAAYIAITLYILGVVLTKGFLRMIKAPTNNRWMVIAGWPFVAVLLLVSPSYRAWRTGKKL